MMTYTLETEVISTHVLNYKYLSIITLYQLINQGNQEKVKKPVLDIITELLSADECALLVHTEKALQHIVNRFSDAAKNFGQTISLKKTEVLYQTPPREAYSPLHISIDGTKLNAVEQFTLVGSVISSDATVSKDLV